MGNGKGMAECNEVHNMTADYSVNEERTLAQAALPYICGLEKVATAAGDYSTMEHLLEDILAHSPPLLIE